MDLKSGTGNTDLFSIKAFMGANSHGFKMRSISILQSQQK